MGPVIRFAVYRALRCWFGADGVLVVPSFVRLESEEYAAVPSRDSSVFFQSPRGFPLVMVFFVFVPFLPQLLSVFADVDQSFAVCGEGEGIFEDVCAVFRE